LLGGALMVNGAAFDWRALARAPAPKSIKSAVRLEGAAILALGAPAAIFLAANASAAASGEPAAGPLLRASVAAVKGFAIGGCVSLCIVLASNWLGARAARNRARRIEGKTIALGALVVFFVAPMFGGDPVFACLAAGLVWSEETHARLATRIALRGLIERTVTPVTYVCFGALFAPRVLQADLLTIIFALIAVTVLRAAPRLAILSSNKITRESRFFLAWFGGAPGAASALFLMTLLNSQALADQDGVLTVGAVAVVAGVIAARLTSRPLTNGYIRAADVARRRRLFAE
ncbi:MAG: cation:proton antiporter, partial [Pseudomonadota bacterium]